LSSVSEDYVNSPLWPILVDTAHALAMYRYHKHYVSTVIFDQKPDTAPKDLSIQLGIPLGEALVILHELGEERTKPNPEPASASPNSSE